MDELTMLVEVAGGAPGTVDRLRAAGLRRAKEIAGADAERVGQQCGVSTAVARRLIKAAQEVLEPEDERWAHARRNGLSAVTPLEQRWRPEAPPSTPAAVRADSGVSHAESSALVGEAPRDEIGPDSFWRFG